MMSIHCREHDDDVNKTERGLWKSFMSTSFFVENTTTINLRAALSNLNSLSQRTSVTLYNYKGCYGENFLRITYRDHDKQHHPSLVALLRITSLSDTGKVHIT